MLALVGQHGHHAVADAIRLAAADYRSAALPSTARSAEAVAELIVASAVDRLSRTPRRLGRVINGTGVIIHTNLGRAPLGEGIARRAAELGAGYSNLELDLNSGRRGDRQQLLSGLLQQLGEAEAAMVVNNGAAAVLLGLTTLCRGREVIVSRGEAIEIGGGFRIPEILRLSGARLVEVGTTNRTRVGDYLGACGGRTAAFLRVHQSNFRMEGFVARPGIAELASAAHQRELLLLEDVGSGLLAAGPAAVRAEDRIRSSIRAGVDLLFCSGDKLVGGSQAGLILGRHDLVARLRRHPLARALRPDKLQLAVLEETLLCFETPGRLEEIPVWRMLGMPPGEIRGRAESWAAILNKVGIPVEVIPMEGAVGGGTTPGDPLPSFGILLKVDRPGAARKRLLQAQPPVLGLERKDGVALDARCVLPNDEPLLLASLQAVFGGAR